MALEYVVRNEKGWVTGAKYPQEKVQVVIEKYPNHTIAECSEFSGLSKAIVYKIARENGIEKSEEFKQKQRNHFMKISEHSRFKKGQISHNKGKKWNEYMSEEGQKNSLKTCFKKGNIPHNHKPVGTERITKYEYVEVKITEPNVWEIKHRLVWEQHNGKIPKGFNIQFKDRNPKNCAIENLYMIDRNNQVRENSIHNYPEDIKKAIRNIGKLSKIINKMQENE